MIMLRICGFECNNKLSAQWLMNNQGDSQEETGDGDQMNLLLYLMADSIAAASNDEEMDEYVLEDWRE